jgi:hypothetical protein
LHPYACAQVCLSTAARTWLYRAAVLSVRQSLSHVAALIAEFGRPVQPSTDGEAEGGADGSFCARPPRTRVRRQSRGSTASGGAGGSIRRTHGSAVAHIVHTVERCSQGSLAHVLHTAWAAETDKLRTLCLEVLLLVQTSSLRHLVPSDELGSFESVWLVTHTSLPTTQ